MKKSLLKPETYKDLLVLAVIFGVFMLMFRLQPVSETDPDTFFHYGVSRAIVDQADFTPNLAAFKDLGWDKNFVDKEWLFHVLTGSGYYFAEEAGVNLVTSLLGLLILLSLFVIGRRYGSSWLVGSVLLSTLLFFTLWSFRISIVRPHLLSILLMIWIVDSFVMLKTTRLFVATFLFGLAYHAFYLHLALIGGICAFRWAIQSELDYRALGLYFVAMVAGIVINPGGIEVLGVTWQHLEVALGKSGTAKFLAPTETIPYPTDVFMKVFFPIFFCVLLLGSQLQTHLRRLRSHDEENRLLIESRLSYGLVGLLFFFLLFFQLRSVEYVVPFFAMFLMTFKLANKKAVLATTVISLTLISIGTCAFMKLAPSRDQIVQSVETRHQALLTLKEQSPGHIGYSSWGHGSEGFYLLPEFTHQQTLDPSFLLLSSPEKYKVYEGLLQGHYHPYLAMRHGQGFDYFVSQKRKLSEILVKDPSFELLNDKSPYVFKLKPSMSKRFLQFTSTNHGTKTTAFLHGTGQDKCVTGVVTAESMQQNATAKRLLLRSNSFYRVSLKHHGEVRVARLKGRGLEYGTNEILLPKKLSDMPVLEIEACHLGKGPNHFVDVQAWPDELLQKRCNGEKADSKKGIVSCPVKTIALKSDRTVKM